MRGFADRSHPGTPRPGPPPRAPVSKTHSQPLTAAGETPLPTSRLAIGAFLPPPSGRHRRTVSLRAVPLPARQEREPPPETAADGPHPSPPAAFSLAAA